MNINSNPVVTISILTSGLLAHYIIHVPIAHLFLLILMSMHLLSVLPLRVHLTTEHRHLLVACF